MPNDDLQRLATIGAKTAILLSEYPTEAVAHAIYARGGSILDNSWDWLREALLIEQPGSLKTGGVEGEGAGLSIPEGAGPLTFYDGLGFWIGGTCFEDGGAFHHASEAILREAAETWNQKRRCEK